MSGESVERKEKMEARTGIEPVIELLQSPALPLGYPALGSADCIRPQKKVNCVTSEGSDDLHLALFKTNR